MTTPFATELPLLTRLFPFLCVLDRDLVVAHAGPSLVKLLGRTPVGEDFAEVFTVDPLYGRLDAGRMSGLRDQLFVARPVLGHGSYRAPVRGLYLCGSGTHPGGGVTGVPGHNAARVILRDARRGLGR